MKCSFCDYEIAKGTGKMFVKVDGKIYYFCSNKCEKNTFKLSRKPRTTTWTNEYQKIKHQTKSTGDKK